MRDLVRAEEVGPAEPGQDREEALGLAELVLEQVEGVRQRVADRDTEAAQPEALGEHGGLVPDADRGLDEVGVVEAQAGVDHDLLDAEGAGVLDARAEVVEQVGQRVGVESGGVRRARTSPGSQKQRITAAPYDAAQASISSSPSRPVRLRTRAPAARHGLDDLGLVGLHRDDALLGERLDHGHEGRPLLRRASTRAARAVLDSAPRSTMLRTLRDLGAGLADRGLGGDRDALAVRRVAGEVDRAHEHGVGAPDGHATHGHRLDRHGEVVGVLAVQRCQCRQRDHPGSVDSGPGTRSAPAVHPPGGAVALRVTMVARPRRSRRCGETTDASPARRRTTHLPELYAVPDQPWLRVNMVSTRGRRRHGR